ncbi:hypothetical protein OQA88_9615 [Cercophora sp. LCS_1]
MATFTFPLIASSVLFILVYKYVIYPAFLSPLARIPNAHWSAPFSRAWILGVRFGKRESKTLFSAHKRLGSNVVRVGPNELSLDGLEAVKIVYGGGWDKGSWYGVFDNYGVPCMFSAKGAAEHSAKKRMISHVYSKSFIQGSQAAKEQAREIIYGRLLPALVSEGGVSVHEREPSGLDVYSLFMAATMDFIAAYIFGLNGGADFLRKRAFREHFLELYKARNDYSIFDQEMPWFTGFCRRLGIPLCPTWVDAANQEMGAWCRGLCEARAERSRVRKAGVDGGGDVPVVWNALAEGMEKEMDTNGVGSVLCSTALTNSKLSVSSELFDHVLAGQETAGLVLAYLSWRLSKSLKLQQQLRAELLGLKPNMQLATEGDSTPAQLPDARQLDSLPLLHAVLMETLRLHAPIPGLQPRQSPDSGSRIGEYAIPGGIRVAAMAYSLHRDEDVFPDPETWDHTRWLPSTSTDEERKRRNRHFWAFSSGGRMCIGSNFAMNEMKLVIAAIYSNYTSHIVDDEGMASQSDGYAGRPAKESLYLRFEKALGIGAEGVSTRISLR